MNIKTRKTMQLAIVAAVAVLLIFTGRKASAQDEPTGKSPSDSSPLATSNAALGLPWQASTMLYSETTFRLETCLPFPFLPSPTSPLTVRRRLLALARLVSATIQADHWIELKESSMLKTLGHVWPWTVFSTQAAASLKTRYPPMAAGYRSQAHTL